MQNQSYANSNRPLLKRRAHRTTPHWVSLILPCVVVVGACSFSTREPEPPIVEGGTYLQPDTPDQVIENLRFAIRELNTQNYRRSLAGDLFFQPTATAEARDPIWSGWGLTEEEQYFSTLVAASTQSMGQDLELNDVSLVAVDERTSVLDATYIFSVFHNRAEVPQVAQGQLSWRLIQREDGLWVLQSWIDQEIGAEPSWSDLKAAFGS